jgi:hypothetical protein
MTTKLVCTVELDLPEGQLESIEAQAPLLKFWKEFTQAMPDQGISGARIDSRVVKSKLKSAKVDGPLQVEGIAASPTPGGEPAMPGFLKRT